MMNLGIFCTVARTELKEKFPGIEDGVLDYLNYAIKQAHALSDTEVAELKLRLDTVEQDAAHQRAMKLSARAQRDKIAKQYRKLREAVDKLRVMNVSMLKDNSLRSALAEINELMENSNEN